MSTSDFDKIKDFAYDIIVNVVDFASKFLPEKKPKKESIEKVKIIGHRGTKGKRSFKENTFSAFNYCIGSGADGIELDVHLTKDDQIIVNHDETLSRVFNKNINIRNEKLKIIQENAPDVLTLQKVFNYYQKQDIVYFIEIKDQINKEKDTLLCYKVVKEIIDNNLINQAYIISININHLIDCKKFYEQVKVLPITLLSPNTVLEQIDTHSFNGILLHFTLCNENIIARAKIKDNIVGSGIVNYLNVAKREIYKGVDFIITDDVKIINKTNLLR